jgi:tRNA threonylcarbamoyl adenosine modification protein (Sua5/YciO/YrdC/YwlC family)
MPMAQIFEIHPKNPQQNLISKITTILNADGIIVYPTDSAYALGCKIGNKDGLARIRRIRELDKTHNFTLMCRDLSELATYAQVNNTVFRLLKANIPGAYTFILEATREVPKLLQHAKRRTIGLRVPDNAIAMAILEALGEPLLSVTAILPNVGAIHESPLHDPEEAKTKLAKLVDAIVDGGVCSSEPTTVVDCLSDMPKIIRKGKGDTTPFEY